MSDYYEDAYTNFSIDPSFSRKFNVTDYYLIDVKMYGPLHAVTVAFLAVVLLSLITNNHCQNRPKVLFTISCVFFLLAALYNLAMDITYLLMRNNRVSF